MIGFVVLGASNETGLKRTLPAIFRLYCSNSVADLKIVAVCQDEIKDQDFRRKAETYLGPGNQDEFLSKCSVLSGDFSCQEIADSVGEKLKGINKIIIYYVPPSILETNAGDCLAKVLGKQCSSENDGWLRVCVEKPLGKDAASSKLLSNGLLKTFGGEDNIFRLDHFLGKEMVQNIVALRFANRFLEPSWNNNHINAVIISCRESILVKPKSYAEYFDEYGILREIILDHLLHIMGLVAMETPISFDDGKSIRDEVSKVMRCVEPLKAKHLVLGQYEGYQKTPGVADDSNTPTFATLVLYINNPRWHGVPFILKAGKGMYEKRTDIRINFKTPHNKLFPPNRGGGLTNELVIRVQPNSDIYMKMMRKTPGMKFHVIPTKLDLIGNDPQNLMDISGHAIAEMNGDPTHSHEQGSSRPPRPRRQSSVLQPAGVNSFTPTSYERLLYDVINGDRTSMTRNDELEALWDIISPVLKELEGNPKSLKEKLISYPIGSRGPAEAYELMQNVGFFGYKLESELLGVKSKTILQSLMSQFTITAYQLEDIVSKFGVEFRKGLAGDPNAPIKMLPSYVRRVPDGTEEGVYYALDLGGTNFRVTRFVLDGKGGFQLTDERKYTVPDEKMTGTAEELFDFLAECVSSLDVDGPDVQRTYGFTFSFPMDQASLDSGILITWTKGFKTSGVVGEDVVKLLNDALERIGFKAKIVAVLNDTVGTLAACAYNSPDCQVGIILGTGTNAAYRERLENIPKLPASEREAGGETIINTEWGNFSGIPFSEVDDIIDAASRNPGKQRFEKTISGMYLGEMARICLEKLHEAGEIWATARVPEELHQPGTFKSYYLSDIEFDMSRELKNVQRVEGLYGVFDSSLEDRTKLKEICGMVVARAAKLTACGIAALLRQIGPERSNSCTVGFDGSLFEKHPSFRQRLANSLGELACSCNLVLAKDGSGKGAALIACGALK